MSTLTNARPWLRGQRAAIADSIFRIARCGLLALPMLVGVSPLRAADCSVDAPITYAAIQHCIDNVAGPGDTVRVGEGTLRLEVGQFIRIPTTKLGIRLVGAGIGRTTIVGLRGGNDGLGAILRLGSGPEGSGATLIEGFTFSGDTNDPTGEPIYRAIMILRSGTSSSEPAVIQNNEFRDVDNGIIFAGPFPRYYRIGPGNVFDGAEFAIALNNAAHLSIIGNVFRKYQAAIFAQQGPEDTEVLVEGNSFEGGSLALTPHLPPPAYRGIQFNDALLSNGFAKTWTIRDNKIVGATWGISIESFAGVKNLSGVRIVGNCVTGNEVLGQEDNTPADFRNASPLPLNAANNFGGTPVAAPTKYDVGAGLVTVSPWLQNLTYTGSTTFLPTNDVVLQATVHNTDGTSTGRASGVLVPFYLIIDGEEVYQGSGVSDADGKAIFSMPAPYAEWTRTVMARAAAGCLEASATITVAKRETTTVYIGQTYDADGSGQSVIAARISNSCRGNRVARFVVQPLAGAPMSFDATIDAETGIASLPLNIAQGIYEVIASYDGSAACEASSDSAVLVVAGPGDSANGGGWYRVDGYAPPRVNFGFTVQKVMQAGQTAGHKGQLLWMNNSKWRLKGVVDTDAAAYGTFPCPSWTGYAGVTDNPVCAAFRGSGLLEAWDATGMRWLPATAYGNNGAVTFTATAYDGGTASICKKKACSYGDVADYFGIQIDPVPGTVLPESLPMLLMGGSIKAQ
jgi:hypothetical protein